MSRGRILLVGGGVRSGKSAFALTRAEALGARRVFVATAQALDDEMAVRIARHQDERADRYRTVEAPVELPAALAAIDDADVVVVDCVTLWLSNLLLREEPEAELSARLDALVAVLRQRRFHAVVVTNEVGMGVVPPTPLGRAFRDLAGTAHKRLAACADEIHLAVLGTVLRLRPEPVAVVSPLLDDDDDLAR
ncbi:MAG TPA: bifunctional adenosylcobinamide kinase/adenosylcobinamide-phosphate guanylyltransferase [Kofleriaceae bacterium]|nr:bifunctional adenosylcobinamide kinase/adenosylcobinamide-phosphate guanylyltransferase [Kofleriaceae bacterium]